MPIRPLFCIAVATYNNPAMLKRCLDAVYSSAGIGRSEVIVVNNGQGREGKQVIASYQEPQPVGVIENPRNVGVGAAYNQALTYCHAPYFVTLNDDLVVRDPQWLSKLRQPFIDDPKMAAVGVMTPQTCFRIDPDGLGCQGEPGEELEYIEGACMMVRASVVRGMPGGLFDPVYRFGYFEDNDLSLRMRKRGWHIGAVEFAVEHGRASTTQRVIAEGVDVDGFHAYNQEVYKTRWQRYLRRRSFTQRVAIRRTGAIGDVIFLTPVLREIKRRNSWAEITVYTDCPDALADNPDVAWTFPADVFPATKFDRVIDLDGAYECRPHLHIIDAYAEVCGIECPDKRTYVNPGRNAREWVEHNTRGMPYAVIHPHIGQRWLGRNPEEILFVEISRYLRNKGYKVVLIGGERYPTTIQCDLYLQGKTSLRQAFAIVERASLFVGVDSALMNVAQASLIPTVGIFGAMNPKNILLPHPFVTALTAPPDRVGCLGCHTAYGVRPAGSPGRCMRETDICMSEIKVEDAIAAIDRVVKMMTPYGETSKIRERVLPYCEGKGIEIGCGRDPLDRARAITVDDGHWPEVDIQRDGRKLPFSDETFDFLYSSHMIEDVDDTEAVVKEWARVVRRGGRVIIATPEPNRFTGYNSEHVWSGFTPEELSEYVGMAGCEVEIADIWADYSTVVVGRKP